jgi:hypothetical protein
VVAVAILGVAAKAAAGVDGRNRVPDGRGGPVGVALALTFEFLFALPFALVAFREAIFALARARIAALDDAADDDAGLAPGVKMASLLLLAAGVEDVDVIAPRAFACAPLVDLGVSLMRPFCCSNRCAGPKLDVGRGTADAAGVGNVAFFLGGGVSPAPAAAPALSLSIPVLPAVNSSVVKESFPVLGKKAKSNSSESCELSWNSEDDDVFDTSAPL